MSKFVGKARLGLTAVGRFVRSVHTVVVAVAHPDAGNAALSDDALELVGCARHLGYNTDTRRRLEYKRLRQAGRRQARDCVE